MAAKRKTRRLTMKTVALILIAFFALSLTAPAQQKPKQGVRDQMQETIESIKKDIANLEKQIERAKARKKPGNVQDLEKELETKKNLLSMMEGGMKSMEKVSDKDLQNIAAGEDRVVPKKDPARIARVPKTILTDSELKAFILKTHAAVEKKIDPKMKNLAQQVYQSVKAKYSSVTAAANAANGGWSIGAPEMALWLMGKACTEDANPDNLNNYAAFLTMAGAEEAALPILMNLNQKFPDNSTLLNNIGQAWFGLGDLEQSEKHLDGAIRIFALHSQANYTKCLIEESRGNTARAIDALKKSIQQAYTSEKANKLRKLGGKLTDKDIAWNFRMPQDPLGLHKFIVPRYAKNVDEAEALDPEWQRFRDACRNLLDGLKLQEKSAESAVQAVMKERDKLIKEHEQFVKGRMSRASTEAIGRHRSDTLNQASTLGMALSPLGQKALKKSELSALEGHYMRERRKNDAKLQQTKKEIESLRKQMRQRLDEINKKYPGGGEGSRGTPEEVVCAAREEVVNKFLVSANTLLEQIQADILTTEMRQINEDTYWKQFIEEDPSFQLTKNRAKQKFLNQLLSLQHATSGGDTYIRWVPGTSSYPCKKKGAPKPAGGKLPEFDDIHCEYVTTLDMPFLGSIKVECNKMTTQFGAGPLSLNLKENLNTNEIIRGTVEVGFSKGLGDRSFGGKYGPLSAELKGTIGGFVEFDDSGITDLGLKAGVKMEVGTNIYDKTITLDDGSKYNPPIPGDSSLTVFGLEARYGWNSGGSLKGKGILRGIDVK